MKKLSLILVLAICVLALASCSKFEKSDDTLHTLPKGTADYVMFEAVEEYDYNVSIQMNPYFFWPTKSYHQVEFEYVSENLIKITESNGTVTYWGASQLIRMERVTLDD